EIRHPTAIGTTMSVRRANQRRLRIPRASTEGCSSSHMGGDCNQRCRHSGAAFCKFLKEIRHPTAIGTTMSVRRANQRRLRIPRASTEGCSSSHMGGKYLIYTLAYFR
nr:hypothetical protein [Tanacetum cinerariifolium]